MDASSCPKTNSVAVRQIAILLTCLLGAAPGLLHGPAGSCEAAESRDFFKADVTKQKAKIEKDLGDADSLLVQNKIRDARSEVELVEYEYKQAKNNLSQEESVAIRAKIDKIRNAMASKEDLLVKRSSEILHSQGVDSALQYTQNDLRAYGVSDAKIGAAEKKILEEAPAIKQAQEHDAIARALRALESGQSPDPSTDPYIVRTAQRILQARADSVKSVQDAKARKEMEENERAERARMAKEQKEKKKEEENLAKVKAEEEKKRKAEEDRQKQLLAQQEKARRDSIDAQRKQQEQQSKLEEGRRKLQAAQEEKARKDSLEAAKKQQEQQAKVKEDRRRQQAAQEDKTRKDSLEAAQKLQQQAKVGEDRRKQQAAQEDKVRKDSLEAAKKQQEQQAKIEEDRRRQQAAQDDNARKDSLEAAQKLQQQDEDRRRQQEVQQARDRQPSAEADRRQRRDAQQEKLHKDSLEMARKQQEQQAKLEEDRLKQQSAQQKKARKDSLEMAKKQEEQQARLDEDQRKRQAAQQERARKDSLDAAKKQQQLQAKTDEDRRRQQETRTAETPAALPQPQSALPSEKPQEKAPEASKSVQEYLAGLRDNQKKAQDLVMALYDMIDRKQTHEAIDKFKQERKFIAQFVDIQVFNTLEQAILQVAVETQPKPGSRAAPAEDTVQNPNKAQSKEQEAIDLINGFIQDNKVEAAYAEFRRVEKSLKHYMPANDFKQMKSMVENAYKVRKKGG
jgi:hypothetical protein